MVTRSTVGRTERLLGSVPRIDYADRFTVTPGVDGDPERWARAMFGDVPSAGEVFVWRGILGLRLHRGGRSPSTVAGWRIGARGGDWIRLDAESWFLAANLLVRVVDGEVSLTTLLHYRRFPARLVWPPCAAVHRRLVPRVLRGAAVRVGRMGGARGAAPAVHSRDDRPGTRSRGPGTAAA